MDENAMIEDLIKQLDGGMAKGVETMGCTDCSRTPLACSVPTLHQGLDDYQ